MSVLVRNAQILSSFWGSVQSVNPPDIVARMILVQAEWPDLPMLTGVVTSTIFAKDGTLCAEAGYNKAANVYYYERKPLNLSDTTPTQSRIKSALELIEDFITDFPFANQSSKSHAIAFLLLPFVREMVVGPTPLHLFDAPKPGTGKSLLMGVLTSVFVPDGVSMQTAPKDDEEWRKKLTTNFREGHSHLLLDNIRELGSENLQAALTAPDCLWKDRLLGVNESLSLPIRCSWAATCNNISGTIEQLRRCVDVRLDARTDRPEERRDFKHSDIRQWAQQNHSKLVAAVVTITRAWVEAGRPDYSGSNAPMGSFEGWTRVMGGILETVGIEGFLDNRKDFTEQSDGESQSLRQFVADWFARHGMNKVKVGDLLITARPYFGDKMVEAGEHANKIRLGKLLQNYRGWVFDEMVLRIEPTRDGSLYSLEPR